MEFRLQGKSFKFTFGEGIHADEIENLPKEFLEEVYFRCADLETADIAENIRACLAYAKDKGIRALIKETDDCNIWEYVGAKSEVKDPNEHYHLAHRPHNYSAAYDYDWYPNMTEKEAKALVKSYDDERTSGYEPYANIYCLDGDIHKEDFIHWKEALENRTQSFAHDDVRINDENVAKLEPRGYIVMITEPNN